MTVACGISFSKRNLHRSVVFTVSGDNQRRGSRWERWNLSRAKKDKVASQPNIPVSLRGDGVVIMSQPYVLSESGMVMEWVSALGAVQPTG